MNDKISASDIQNMEKEMNDVQITLRLNKELPYTGNHSNGFLIGVQLGFYDGLIGSPKIAESYLYGKRFIADAGILGAHHVRRKDETFWDFECKLDDPVNNNTCVAFELQGFNPHYSGSSRLIFNHYYDKESINFKYLRHISFLSKRIGKRTKSMNYPQFATSMHDFLIRSHVDYTLDLQSDSLEFVVEGAYKKRPLYSAKKTDERRYEDFTAIVREMERRFIGFFRLQESAYLAKK